MERETLRESLPRGRVDYGIYSLPDPFIGLLLFTVDLQQPEPSEDQLEVELKQLHAVSECAISEFAETAMAEAEHQ